MYRDGLLWFPPPPNLLEKTYISVMANIIFDKFEYVSSSKIHVRHIGHDLEAHMDTSYKENFGRVCLKPRIQFAICVFLKQEK